MTTSLSGKPIFCGDCKKRLTKKNRASDNGAGKDFDDLCTVCYDRAGLENEHQDGQHEPGEFPQDCPLCEQHLDTARHARKKPGKEVAKGSISKGISRDTKGLDASKAKARALLGVAESLGWSLKDFETEDDTGSFFLNLINEDTSEEISAFWVNGVWQHPCMYRYSGRELKINNASAARKRMASEPDLVIRKPRVVSSGEESESGGRIVTYRVPFDPIEASDAEIFSAVYGRKLVWENKLSGNLEEAFVTGKKSLRLSHSETSDRRILHFVDNITTGFRAVALENLVQVV